MDQQWCFLWAEPCLSSSEWAAWAQAIFSALAILAAFGVVWWQLRVTKKRDEMAAKLAVGGILAHIEAIVGGLISVERGLNDRTQGRRGRFNEPQYLAMLLGALPLPSRDDLLALNAEMPSSAMTLLRASNTARKVQLILEFLSKDLYLQADGQPLDGLFQYPHQLTSEARIAFEEAAPLLKAYCSPCDGRISR